MGQRDVRARIMAAKGDKKAELVLKNARVVNVFTETVEEADIAIEGGVIAGIGRYHGEQETDLKGAYVCPGFIDGHIHLESSMVTPYEFQNAVLVHGTTCVVTDPHEIANVAGVHGIRYMLQAARALALDVFFMIPSCVPSTALDESGAALDAEQISGFYEDKQVLGLAELMNATGTVRCEEQVMRKVEEALARGRIIDGHAPLLTGKELCAYVAAGVASDHECSNMEEAVEKLSLGQWIMVREGTAAKNLRDLIGIFEPPYYNRAMLVTDDKHPGDLLNVGHMDSMLRLAVENGADPVRAVKMSAWNAASYFGLKGRGAVAPGYRADLAVMEDLKEFRVMRVYKDGKLTAMDGRCLASSQTDAGKQEEGWEPEIRRRVFHSFHMREICQEDLVIPAGKGRQRVIDLSPHELLTRERIVEWKERSGLAPGVDPDNDIVKLAVFERHHGTGHVGLGFLGNYGLKKGAVATSVGHDSHNLVIAGTTDPDMTLAGNEVIRNRGGLAVALDGEILGSLALPIAGLMSDRPLAEVEEKLRFLKELLKKLGISEEIDGFMTLAFVSLPVIPQLRLNTYGIVDVNSQKIVKAVF